MCKLIQLDNHISLKYETENWGILEDWRSCSEICQIRQIRPWFRFPFLKFIWKMNLHIQTLSNSRDCCDRSVCALSTFSENLRDLPKSFTKISSSSKKYYVGHCGLLYFVYFWALHCYHNLYLFRFWYSYTLVHKSGYGKYAEQL